MNIYILGNGFDLAHGLQTSYKDFIYFIYNKYVKNITKNNFEKDFLKIIYSIDINMTEVEYIEDKNNMGIINPSYAVKWFIALFNYIDDSKEEYWSKLEEALGLIEYSQIIDQYDFFDTEENLSFLNAYYDSLTYKWPDVAGFIKVCLREWIESLSKVKCVFEKFSKDIMVGENLFVTFNYTLTLEENYNIDSMKIIHIHGKKGDSEYIFGHGKEVKENWDSSTPYVQDNINSVDKIFKKDIQDSKLEEFLSGFKSVLNEDITIRVIGFSFGDVDENYIKKLCNLFPSAKWILNEYKKKENDYATKLIENFGVLNKNITTEKLLVLDFPNNQMKL